MNELHDKMARAGVRCDDNLIVDGRIHRFAIGGRGNKNGWYVFHRNGDQVFGAFGDWKSGTVGSVGAKDSHEVRAVMQQVKAESNERAEAAAKEASELWSRLRKKSSDQIKKSLYLQKKGLADMVPEDVWCEFEGGVTYVPMYTWRSGAATYGMVGLQKIYPDGAKRFTAGMKKAGSWHQIGFTGGPTVLCEGFATGMSIYACTRIPVLVAFDCGNMLPAARNFSLMREELAGAPVRWIVAADNDHKTDGNPGLTAAMEAATELGARIVVPDTVGTDFNDMHVEKGKMAVLSAFYEAL